MHQRRTHPHGTQAAPLDQTFPGLPNLPLPFPQFQGEFGPYLAALAAKAMRSNPLAKRSYVHITDVGYNVTDERDADIQSLGVSRYTLDATNFTLLNNLWMEAVWNRDLKVSVDPPQKHGETLGHFLIQEPGDNITSVFYQPEEDPDQTFDPAADFYVDQEVRPAWTSAYTGAVQAYRGFDAIRVLLHNLLNYVLQLVDPIILGLLNQQVAGSLGSPDYGFVWELTFALFSDATWDFDTNTLTLPVEDISWIGHFNNSKTMGFGTVAGLSVRGSLSVSLTGFSYDLAYYVLVPDGESFYMQFPSGTHAPVRTSATSRITPLILFPGLRKARSRAHAAPRRPRAHGNRRGHAGPGELGQRCGCRDRQRDL